MSQAFSILVPVYNEAPILRDALLQMLHALGEADGPFEIVVAENGSDDGTLAIAHRIAADHPQVRVTHLESPNYGLALKHGLSVCHHDSVMIFNIEFWSQDFVREALQRLQDCDLVIGSKIMNGSQDERPLLRRVITRGFNAFLRAVYGFRGTDTHGMKALRAASLRQIVDACVTDHWIFDTEFVLRAQRARRRIAEIPVHVREYRQPSYGSLIRRVPRVLLNLGRLYVALRRNSLVPKPAPVSGGDAPV